MRGATSTDGKLSGNRQVIDRYESTRGAGKPKDSGGHSGGVHDEGGNDSIKEVVGAHGPAKRHSIVRSEDGAGYSSETEHEDGHVSTADHSSLDEAHDHGRQAMEDTDHNPLNRDSEKRAEGKDRMEAHEGGNRGRRGHEGGSKGIDFLE